MNSYRTSYLAASLLAAPFLAACSSGSVGTSTESEPVKSGPGAGGSTPRTNDGGGNDGGPRAGGSGGSAGQELVLTVDEDAGGVRRGNGTPETCDRIDNDDNGIVDDVDVNSDGVCDCLNIATVGAPGVWSDGNNLFQTWLSSRSPRAATELGDQTLTEDALAPFDIVVMLHVATIRMRDGADGIHHAFTDGEKAAFEGWVRKGGGLMTTIGYTLDESNEVVNVNEVLSSLGTGYTVNRVNGYITDWVPHPLSDGVEKVFIQNGLEVLTGAGTIVARDDTQRTAMRAIEVDDGHVVVWGDEWITYDSEWRDIQDQQVERLWLNIFKYLSPPKRCQVPIPVKIR